MVIVSIQCKILFYCNISKGSKGRSYKFNSIKLRGKAANTIKYKASKDTELKINWEKQISE